MTRFLTPLLALILLTLPARAQELSDELIERWIGSMEAVMAWSNSQPAPPDIQPSQTMFRDIIEAMRDSPDYAAVADILAPHGFDDPLGWAGLSDRITAAYVSEAIGELRPLLEAFQPLMLEQVERELADPNLSQAEINQLQQFREQIKSITGFLEMNGADPADILAVKRNRDAIDALVNSALF